jgi:hypothetical protein
MIQARNLFSVEEYVGITRKFSRLIRQQPVRGFNREPLGRAGFTFLIPKGIRASAQGYEVLGPSGSWCLELGAF